MPYIIALDQDRRTGALGTTRESKEELPMYEALELAEVWIPKYRLVVISSRPHGFGKQHHVWYDGSKAV